MMVPIAKKPAATISPISGSRSSSSGMNGSGAVLQVARERHPQDRRRGEQRQDRERAPGMAHAAPAERQQQQHRGHHHQRGADHVERVRAVVARDELERAVGHRERDVPSGSMIQKMNDQCR